MGDEVLDLRRYEGSFIERVWGAMEDDRGSGRVGRLESLVDSLRV
jgi:hypothetical protein